MPNLLGPAVELQEKYANAQITFHAAFMDYLEVAKADPLDQLAMELPSNTATEEHIFLGDLPGFAEWVTDREMGSLQAHNIIVKNKNWASGIPIHRNQIADDKLGIVMKRIEGLADKARKHRGKLLAELLLNGFTGTAFPEVGDGTTYDGALFFSATHALEGGPNQSNLLDHVALGDAGLEAAFTSMLEFTTYDGLDPLQVRPTHIVVGPALKWMAERLAKQELRVRDNGAAGGNVGADTNIHKGSVEVIVSPRIRNYGAAGDFSKAWFLIALDEIVKPFLFQSREPITTAAQTTWDTEDMFKRGQMNFGAQARYMVANYDWRLAVGSLGA